MAETSNNPKRPTPCAGNVANQVSSCMSVNAPRCCDDDPFRWFDKITANSLQYVRQCSARGMPIVGMMCEFTPRELVMAAGAVPVVLCGGSAETIPSAEKDLPTNLCPLIKSTFGYHTRRSNPFLEMADLVIAETTCDGKKKMYEIMSETRPMMVLDLPNRSESAAGLAHWTDELRTLRTRLEEKFSVEITDEKLRHAIRFMNTERHLRRKLARTMEAVNPPITGRELMKLRSIVGGNPTDLERYEAALRAIAEQPRHRGRNPKSRVLLTGVPLPHGAERVVDIIEDRGGMVVCMENCTGLRPLLEDVDETSPDPVAALAAKYFHLPCSVMSPNQARVDSLATLAERYDVDCCVELVWQSCLTYDVESFFVRNLCEKKLNIPYLRIETDYSSSDSARIAVRVEALFESVRSKRN